MSYQIFVSTSIWPIDSWHVEPFREFVRSFGWRPWTVGIDEFVSDEEAPFIAARRIKESAGMLVVLSRRYSINGYLPSMYVEQEPVIAAMTEKPVIAFYETGVEPVGIIPKIAIECVKYDRSALLQEVGKNRIRERIEHLLWHAQRCLSSWKNVTRPIGWLLGVGAALRFRVPWLIPLTVIGGDRIGEWIGNILDQHGPPCSYCGKIFPPRL